MPHPSGQHTSVTPLYEQDDVLSRAPGAWEIALDPPIHVPIFLLDSALLI
jgi:hypothetical protein